MPQKGTTRQGPGGLADRGLVPERAKTELGLTQWPRRSSQSQGIVKGLRRLKPYRREQNYNNTHEGGVGEEWSHSISPKVSDALQQQNHREAQ